MGLLLALERFKKYCGHWERGFLGSDEALAKEHVRSDLRLSRNEVRTQKDRVVLFYAEWLQYLLIRSKPYFVCGVASITFLLSSFSSFGVMTTRQ